MTQATGQGRCQQTECYGYANAARWLPWASSGGSLLLLSELIHAVEAKEISQELGPSHHPGQRESTAYWDSSVFQAFLTC